MCTMKTCRKSLLILLKVIHIILLPDVEAQEIEVPSEVTGYLGHDVTLPCKFTPGPKNDTITQVEWDLMSQEGEKLVIVVDNPRLGSNVSDTILKGRVEIAEQSLIIRSVEMSDAGSYICNIAAYPSGSLEGTTNLIVQEKVPLSSGAVSAIVIAVMLLFVIMAAIAYFIFIRRPHSTVRHRVYIDTSGAVRDVFRPSVIVREEEVVYSHVKLKPSIDDPPSSNEEHTKNTYADDVTYSDVRILRRPPKLRELY